ncbi:MAG: AAA family ATPase [Candidatus Aenigmarchaeota archaeon]|nr:AAA family ATPase [Candidatus Aenigmarchaeota archaeon]
MVNDFEGDIIRILSVFNPWWETRKIPYVEEFKRLDFRFLKSRVPEKEIISIIGARQVGKTTLMEQLIELLIKQISPNRILMIYGDNTELNTLSKNVIKDCFDIYERFILKEEITRIQKSVYVFIDEVQKIDNWFNIVKDYYNINKNIKFIVSGSSSVKILEESAKAFVGRAETQIVVPFKFLELIRFHNFRNKRVADDVIFLENISEIRDGLKKLMETRKVTKRHIFNFFKLFDKEYKQTLIFEKTVKKLLDDYFIKGGYPAIIKEPNLRRCINILTTNIRDVINTDIKNVHKIRESYTMEKLLVLLSKDTSENINIANISSILEMDIKTISQYIEYLGEAFIISTAENYRYSKVNRLKKKIKKIYLNDIGLRNVINNTFDESILLNQREMGKIAETIVHNHCIRLKFKISPQTNPKLFYWRDDEGEIDIIFEHKNKPIPIEVKYKNKIGGDDLKTIRKFIQNYKSGFGLCITKDTFGIDDKILMLPIWLFLLVC